MTATAIYTRISQDRDKLKAGVARQERECRELAERRGWAIAPEHVYSDPSTSALRRKRRPGFTGLQAAVESGQVTRIIAWHPDRLTRNPAELETLIAIIGERPDRVDVATVVAGDYDLGSATGRMIARQIGAAAAYESELKAERTTSKHRELALKGRRAGGPRPYGYTDARCSAIVPDEAEAMCEAFARVIRGDSLSAISRDLNARGVLTTRGRPWNASALLTKLRSPHLAGLRSYKGKNLDGAWEPIIDRDTWARVDAILSDPQRCIRKPAVPFLLHGLTITPEGAPMVGKLNRGTRSYMGPGVAVTEADLEAIVLRQVFRRLSKRRLVPSLSTAEVDRLTAERATLEAERDGYKAMRLDGTLTMDDFRDLMAPVAVRLREVTERLAQVETVAPTVAELVRRPGALEAAWAIPEGKPGHLTITERRAALRSVLTSVTVAPAKSRSRANRLIRTPERVSYGWVGER